MFKTFQDLFCLDSALTSFSPTLFGIQDLALDGDKAWILSTWNVRPCSSPDAVSKTVRFIARGKARNRRSKYIVSQWFACSEMRGHFIKLRHTPAPSFLPEAFPHLLSQIMRIVCGIESHNLDLLKISAQTFCGLREDDDPTEECPERHLSLDCGETSSCNTGLSKCVQFVPFHRQKAYQKRKQVLHTWKI